MPTTSRDGSKPRPGATIGMAVGVVVFLFGYFVFPPESTNWSDRGPHTLTTTLIAGVVAGVVAVLANLGSSAVGSGVTKQLDPGEQRLRQFAHLVIGAGIIVLGAVAAYLCSRPR